MTEPVAAWRAGGSVTEPAAAWLGRRQRDGAGGSVAGPAAAWRAS